MSEQTPTDLIIANELPPEKEPQIKQLLIEIGKKALELTSHPQTNIEPTDYLPDGFSIKERNRKLTASRLPEDNNIHQALQLHRLDLGTTNFLIIREKDNQASIRHTIGATDTATLEKGVRVDPDYQEFAIDVIRKKPVKKGSILGIGSKDEYYYTQIVIGGIPGDTANPETCRVDNLQIKDKSDYEWLINNFSTNRSLSDMRMTLKKNDRVVPVEEQGLRTILGLMNQGSIDRAGMRKAIARKREFGTILTSEEFKHRQQLFSQSNPESDSASPA